MLTLNKKIGFTLIELMVVISIISLLTTVVFISTRDVVKKARDIRTITNLRGICNLLQMYYDDNNYFPFKGCSFTGEPVSQHYGKYRDNPNNDPYGNKIFDILQDDLAPQYVSWVPNDPAADYPANDWSYFYDNYYDSVDPSLTPGTSECSNQNFQILGYIEDINNLNFPYEMPWGTWQGKGWWRACKGINGSIIY